jgi:hypothetical protein
MEELELDLVDVETAVKLVERGCYLKSKKFVFKDKEEEINDLHDNIKLHVINKEIFAEIYGTYKQIYTLPELELVSKWLMEKKDINITICLLRREFGSLWYYNIDNINVDKIIQRWHPKDPTYSKYEEALLEAIKFSLTFIPKIDPLKL